MGRLCKLLARLLRWQADKIDPHPVYQAEVVLVLPTTCAHHPHRLVLATSRLAVQVQLPPGAGPELALLLADGAGPGPGFPSYPPGYPPRPRRNAHPFPN